MSLSLDKNLILNEINKSLTIDDVEKIRIKYLGKKGLISLEMKSLSLLLAEEKKSKGKELNIFKSFFELELKNIKNKIESISLKEKLNKEKIDYFTTS